MDQTTHKKPFRQFKTGPMAYIAAMIIMMLPNAIGIIIVKEGILLHILSLVSMTVVYALAGFFFYAEGRGRPWLGDIRAFFTAPGVFRKAFPLIMAEFAISQVGVAISNTFVETNLLLSLALLLISSALLVFILPVRYMFFANMDYSPSVYFAMSIRYMKSNVFKYFGIILKYCLIMFVVMFILLLGGIVGLIAIIPFILVIMAVMEIEIIQLMHRIIPQEWDAGPVQ